MAKPKYQIKRKVTEGELLEIKIWLGNEAANNSGFYHNWNIIEKAKLDNQLFIIKDQSCVIGFLVWSNREIYAEIDIFEIIPSHRKKGIGEYFFNEVCKYWNENNFCVLLLFCEPKESEKFWKKMNFIKFPDTIQSLHKLTYYKPLIQINNSNTEIDMYNKLELWDVEPHLVNDTNPQWYWNISVENFLPILAPCESDWNIRLTKNGKVVDENKVKRFSRNIGHSPFLYIIEL